MKKSLLTAVLVGLWTSCVTAEEPPAPFEDEGACPFECCVYRDWTAREETSLLKEPSIKAEELLRIKKGTKVKALTGKVVTERPGQFLVKAPRDSYKANDILYLYTYMGEGGFLVWRTGKMENAFLGCCSDGSIPYCQTQNDKDCWGKVLSMPVSTWWVKIETPDGKIGWTRETGKFGNRDACGDSTQD